VEKHLALYCTADVGNEKKDGVRVNAEFEEYIRSCAVLVVMSFRCD
jgi:hypothetical protein